MAYLEQVKSALADQYVIEREIASGGMGVVYFGRELKLDRPVAIKVIYNVGASERSRFQREITVLSQLSHPNILPILHNGEANDFLYYVTPYIEGESLNQLLDREKKLPIEHALAICEAISRALDTAHSIGVIHRDIKPSNIIVPKKLDIPLYEEVLLTDFGILGVLEQDTNVTTVGQIFGTPTYMAPEQIQGHQQSVSTDTYGLGALLYTMLFGDPPFKEKDTVPLVFSIIKEPVSIPTRPNIPQAVRSFLEQCLSKDPSDRPTSPTTYIQELRASIFAWRDDSEGDRTTLRYEKTVLGLPAAPQAAPQAASRPYFAIWIIGIILLSFGVTLIVYFNVPLGAVLKKLDVSLLTNLATGIALIFSGIIFGFLVRSWLRYLKTRLEKDTNRILIGAKTHDILTRSLALDVDELIERCQSIDERFLGKTLAIMVSEYQAAKNFNDRQAALVTAVQFLDKLMDRLSPWYVRYEKLIAFLVGLVGVTTGIVEIIKKLMT